MALFHHSIGGQWVLSTKTFDVINPATEQVFAQCPQATQQEVEQAVQAAYQAFSFWKLKEADERAAIIQQAQQRTLHHRQDLATLLTQEQGKPLATAMAEIDYVVAALQEALDLPRTAERIFHHKDYYVDVHHQPQGVVVAIEPWNYPVGMAAKIAIPLMLGNTVVLKPSPYTPLTTLRWIELIQDLFPAGVLNALGGGNDVGAWLVRHPLVRTIKFTGSVATGKLIAAACAKDLKRYTLELGGNDPAIVYADVDLDRAIEPLFWGAFSNTGQVCIAIKRLYVHEEVADRLIEKLIAYAKEVKIGDGLSPDTQLGPLNNKNQLDFVEALVHEAVAQGAVIKTGGKRLNQPGYFYPPTLITNVREGMRVVDEEQFGPVLPILTFTATEDVIARANATPYGLGASVWTQDLALAQYTAARLEAGTIWMNQSHAGDPWVDRSPLGGLSNQALGEKEAYGVEIIIQKFRQERPSSKKEREVLGLAN